MAEAAERGFGIFTVWGQTVKLDLAGAKLRTERRPREIRGRRERDVIFRDCQDIWEVSRQLRYQPEPGRSPEPPVGALASTEPIESARL